MINGRTSFRVVRNLYPLPRLRLPVSLPSAGRFASTPENCLENAKCSASQDRRAVRFFDYTLHSTVGGLCLASAFGSQSHADYFSPRTGALQTAIVKSAKKIVAIVQMVRSFIGESLY
jgi:hypothetical protein